MKTPDYDPAQFRLSTSATVSGGIIAASGSKRDQYRER
jgi:hypothetical protein